MVKKLKDKSNSLYCWCIENHKEQLLEEWDYENNGNVTPKDIAKASNIKFNWICSKCGHKWMANLSHRIQGRGCPKCAKKKVADRYSTVTDINDSVLVKYPEIAKEWDYDKNERGPETYYPQSNIKVWWKCERGHSWQAVIYSRTSDHQSRGCPKCSVEKRTSLPEKIIYFYVKKYFPDAKENYHPDFLNKKELDIYIPSISTGIEYDGKAWHKNVNKDALKDEICSKNSVKLFRIREAGLEDYESSSIKIKCGKYKGDCLYLTNPIKTLLKHLGIENPDIVIDRDYETVVGDFLTIKRKKQFQVIQ